LAQAPNKLSALPHLASKPVRFVIALFTISRTTSSRGLKASVAPGSSTITTRACGPFVRVSVEKRSTALAVARAASIPMIHNVPALQRQDASLEP
jgi:hypothetical protein